MHWSVLTQTISKKLLFYSIMLTHNTGNTAYISNCIVPPSFAKRRERSTYKAKTTEEIRRFYRSCTESKANRYQNNAINLSIEKMDKSISNSELLKTLHMKEQNKLQRLIVENQNISVLGVLRRKFFIVCNRYYLKSTPGAVGLNRVVKREK